MFNQLINEDEEKAQVFVFYNDKLSKSKEDKYLLGTRDKMHNNIGSIMGFRFGFCTNEEVLIECVLIISSYGKRFVEDDNKEKELELQRLIVDDLFPCYQRLLEIEMGKMYLDSYSKTKTPLPQKRE